jgi:type VI secretion system protein ImpK
MSPLFGSRKPRPDQALVRRPGAGGPASGGSSRTAARVPTLVELCSDAFSFAYSLGRAADLGDPSEARRRILQHLEQMEEAARSHGVPSHQIDGARFGLVALLDEAILSSSWPGRDMWRANPLQRELFKMNVAGEEFYTRLEQLRQNREENRPVLEVFYACLIMGFEGRYKLLGREKLEALIHSLAADLAPGQGQKMENLSPSWRRPDEFLEVVGEGVPVWVSALTAVGLVLVLILIFRGVALHDSGQAAHAIQGYLQSAGR